jgi:hypothetical protein
MNTDPQFLVYLAGLAIRGVTISLNVSERERLYRLANAGRVTTQPWMRFDPDSLLAFVEPAVKRLTPEQRAQYTTELVAQRLLH